MKVNTYIFYFSFLFIISCSRPIAIFETQSYENKAPSKVSFVNKSKKADQYIWNFGDGSTSSAYEPEHKYIISGKYTVSLTAIKGKKKHTLEKEIFLDAPHDCLIEMETTMGSMTIKLYDNTPKHRDNFIKLAETEFYDGILFHRVINGFMIQAGDPESKNAKKGSRLGSGGLGYTIPAEFVDGLIHIKGALSAARQGDQVNPLKESSSSQFFIVHGKQITENQIDMIEVQKEYKLTKEQREILTEQGGTPILDKEYTVFGQVIKGMEIIDKIATSQTDNTDRPLEDIKILKLRVVK